MPLINIVGLGLSGKTQRAMELKEALEEYLAVGSVDMDKEILVINDEFIAADRYLSYKNAGNEKMYRSNIMSMVERHLSKNKVVICDSLNYIKGFRYQLYCVARAIGTPMCTLYCGLQTSAALERNAVLKRYDPDTFDNLVSRFEEPDGRNRWDAPLFIVVSEDEPLSTSGNQTAKNVIESVILKKPPPPNLSTVVKPLQETNYLHEVDLLTNEILATAMEAQRNGRFGKVPTGKGNAALMIPSRKVPVPEWRRLKRQFIQLNKMHTHQDQTLLAESFTNYLNTNIA